MAIEANIAAKVVAPITIDAGSTLLDLLDLYRANSNCIYWIYRYANTIFFIIVSLCRIILGTSYEEISIL